ncbi:hypothetical protein HU200_007353 [Digitaria exilis]|uniref:At1g61320/AtMIF1 LRR domain-containing protein n=1 Tax=Digitaria exilis TaxID=1010633 RepID=A0A835FNU1_9POAL|nr:hypothetical protein HU200_007353 [Digitaria exilis]
MPMDAAARAACLSHTFLSSWRCYPKLTLTRKALCPKTHGGNLSSRIDSILQNHSGNGLKILNLQLCQEDSSFPYIDSWLQVAVKPGIEELTLFLYKEYKFPSSLLSVGVRSSIRSLELHSCVFRPTLELGPLRSLTRLRLTDSLALEHLDLTHCSEIIFLKIPSVLLHLSYVNVFGCSYLQAVENKSPSLSSFTLFGEVSKLSLGETLQMMKVFVMRCDNVVHYARAKLPSIMPNLETLELGSTLEVNTPMLPTKFLNLKHLIIQVNGETLSPSYDYFSLVSFLDASPSLHLRQLPECHHDRLKSFEVIGSSSAKGLVELTCCIVNSTVSLERLKLDTLRGDGVCCPVSKTVLEEAFRGVAAIRKYIEDKVPPTANLIVLEPCPRCHTTTGDHGW